jgi:rhodanese-related sulfurtransferase
MAKGLMDFVKEAKAQITEINADELLKMQEDDSDMLIVDVREPGEFIHGHIKHAMLVPRGVLEAAADAAFPKSNEILRAAHDRILVVYCATGGRSAMAAKTLQEMGFNQVMSLDGGFTGWESGGHPVFREGEY